MTKIQKLAVVSVPFLMGVIYSFISVNALVIPFPVFSVIVTFLSLTYIFGYHFIPFKKIPVKHIAIVASIFAIILFFSPANIKSDTSSYIIGARTFFLGKMDPYLHPYRDFKSDTIYPNFIGYTWAQTTYTYSPLFLYTSGLLLWLSQGNFWTNAVLFKFLFLITYLGSLLIFGKVVKGSSKYFYLYSLNPIILVELVLGAHIESLIIFLLGASFLFLRKGKYSLSYLSVLAIFLVKIYFVIFLPFYFLAAIGRNKDSISKVLKLSVATLAITAFFYLPFISKSNVFSRIIELILGNSGKIITFNPLTILLMPAGKLFGNDPYLNYILAGKFLFAIGCIFLFFLAVKFHHNRDRLSSLCIYLTYSYLIYLFLLISWFFPHYATVAIFLLTYLASTLKKKMYTDVIFFLSLYSSLYYFILR